MEVSGDVRIVIDDTINGRGESINGSFHIQ